MTITFLAKSLGTYRAVLIGSRSLDIVDKVRHVVYDLMDMWLDSAVRHFFELLKWCRYGATEIEILENSFHLSSKFVSVSASAMQASVRPLHVRI